MRAVDITILLIAIQASIGFINTIGVFDDTNTFFATPQNHWTEQSVSNLSEYSSVSSTSAGDGEMSLFEQASLAVEFLWDGLFFMVDILLAVIVIFPTLINIFHIPIVVSGFLQTFVWFMYYIGWRQWKSGKSVKEFV